jgi:hypothetical protein
MHDTEGIYYRYRLKAANLVGNGDWSEWSDSIMALIVPSDPTSISISAASELGAETDFRVLYGLPLQTGAGDQSWPLLSYSIQVSVLTSLNPLGQSCRSIPGAITVNGTTTSTIVKALTVGCIYRISVGATNLVGEGVSRSYDLLVKVSNPAAQWFNDYN